MPTPTHHKNLCHTTANPMIDFSNELPQFDAGTVDRLGSGSKALAAISGMPLYMLNLAHESGFPDSDLRLQDVGSPHDRRAPLTGVTFPLDARGIPWIERYLARLVGPTLDGGDGQPRADEAETTALRLFTAGAVWGQCVAQELGMRWIASPLDEARPWLVPTDPAQPQHGLDPWHAVREFAQLGEQASLVVYLEALRNQASNDACMVRVGKWLQARVEQVTLDKIHTEQRWHTPEGLLEAVIFLDADEREVGRLVIAALDGITEGEGAKQPVA